MHAFSYFISAAHRIPRDLCLGSFFAQYLFEVGIVLAILLQTKPINHKANTVTTTVTFHPTSRSQIQSKTTFPLTHASWLFSRPLSAWQTFSFTCAIQLGINLTTNLHFCPYNEFLQSVFSKALLWASWVWARCYSSHKKIGNYKRNRWD